MSGLVSRPASGCGKPRLVHSGAAPDVPEPPASPRDRTAAIPVATRFVYLRAGIASGRAFRLAPGRRCRRLRQYGLGHTQERLLPTHIPNRKPVTLAEHVDTLPETAAAR